MKIDPPQIGRKGADQGRGRGEIAFSLLEVMIAVGLFFMVAFTILALVSQNLRTARALQFSRSPIGSLAAQTMLIATNGLEEGMESGDFENIFPEHRWEREVREFRTNGLMEVHLSVSRQGKAQPEAEMTILVFTGTQGAVRRRGFGQ
jgi:hypothetical protein